MASIKDDKGYNQGFKPSKALEVRTERRCDYIVNKIESNGEIRILEIGCGTGELASMISRKTGKKVTGIDVCKPFIENAQKLYGSTNLVFEVIDFNNQDDLAKIGKTEKFDYIIGNGILHHLYFKLDQSLLNIKSMLKSNGKIVFLEPNVFNPYCFLIFRTKMFRKAANLDPQEMAFSRKYIIKKLDLAGYKNIEVKYKDFLLPNTPDVLIDAVIKAGAILEQVPLLKMITQSIYIAAEKLQ